MLTGRIVVEEGHARLQQFEKHDVVKVSTRVHRNFHEKKAAKQRSSDTGGDTECIYVYGIHSAQQTVWVQRENRPKKTIVVHVRELFDIASIFNTPDILQDSS